jgi:hypothetical protein
MLNTKMLLFHERAGSVKGSALPRDMPAVSTAGYALPRDLPAVSAAGSALPRDLPAVSTAGSALPRDLPAVSTAHVSTTLSARPFSLSLHFQAVLVGAGHGLFKGTAPRDFYFWNQSLTKALGDF